MRNAAHNPLSSVEGFSLLPLGAILLLLCLCTVGCAQETATIEKKVLEQDKDKDGVADLRIETHTRGKTKVFIRMARRLPSGAWSVTHSYLLQGETVSMEEDRDGDGFFETLIVFDPPSKDFEVFSRRKDGSVAVASVEVKESYRKMFQAVDEFWDNTPSATDDKTAERLISETKERIDSAGERIGNQHSPSASENERRQKPQ